jgi:hypothetical protein
MPAAGDEPGPGSAPTKADQVAAAGFGDEQVGGAAAQGTDRATGTGGVGAEPRASAWASELSERVIGGVARLKARTTLPVVTILRGLVYGLAAVMALLTAFVLLVVGVVRIWDAYVPVSPLGRRVWLGYVVVGGAVFLAGAALLSRRKARRLRS